MYGRARRIQALKTAGIVAGVLVVIALVALIIFKVVEKNNKQDNFVTLKQYMRQKGFDCELIENPGEACKYNKDGVLARFVRYEDGFSYNVNTDAYYLEIKHTKDDNRFVFRTTDEALKGYRNKIYKCYYEDSIIGTLKECKDEDDRLLDAAVYRSKVEEFMNDLSLIIKGSGYDENKLIKDYQWVDKK